MKKSYTSLFAFGLFFLFFIQLASSLVESIYILDLMNTSLDAKALGVLFFFTPVLLLPFRKRFPGWAVWLILSLLFISRGFVPYLPTLGKMIFSGIGLGSALLLFSYLITAKSKADSSSQTGLSISAGLALAIALSVLLRTLNFSIDYSLTAKGGWVAWVFGLLLGWALAQLRWDEFPSMQSSGKSVTNSVLGVFLLLTLVYFSFSAPAVIARWAEGNYALIVIAVSFLSLSWIILTVSNAALLERISPRGLLVWNLLFSLSLIATLLAQRVSFPLTPDAPALVVGPSTWIQQIPLVLMLIFFPVIFLDMRLFFNCIQRESPTPYELLPGILLGSLALVVLVFIHIFTNVWGYVAPVSTPFRNQFWLPYFLITGGITWNAGMRGRVEEPAAYKITGRNLYVLYFFLAVIFIGTGFSAFRTKHIQAIDPSKTSLIVMTYNIQQANDGFAQESFDRQLELIRKVSPDILALQETDSTRISLNNNDFVRYYASQLGYYVYFGPTTVSGTFGTAILSKIPLEYMHTIFTYSDSDEIGIAVAEVEFGGKRITIYNVHPDGSDTAKLTFARSLLNQSAGKKDVIILGDFNLLDTEEAFQLISSVYTNVWTSVYPSKISADGTDMSGPNRIDHIFISPSLNARNPFYILPPASATDHPVHWAEIFWGSR